VGARGAVVAGEGASVQVYPGRKRFPDRQALCGILFVLHTGIPWMHLPQELGYGSGFTCWRRLEEWQ
jgi:transposase